MPRVDRMFGSVVDPSHRTGGRRQGASVLMATLIEAALVAVLIAVPLMAVDVLPVPLQAMDAFVISSAPPPTPPPPPASSSVEPQQTPEPAQIVDVQQIPIPLEAPTGIAPEPPTDITFERAAGAVPGGLGHPDGVPGGWTGVPPPPVAPPVAPPQVTRVGGNVLPPVKTRHVNPTYPPLAQAGRIEGIVIIQATIGVDGRVTDTNVLRGHPLLDAAALDAVRQWEFTPTLLNGVPTAVIMNVTVTFRLQ